MKVKNISRNKYAVPGGFILPGQSVVVDDKSHKTIKSLLKNYPKDFQSEDTIPVANIAQLGADPKAPVAPAAKAK